MNTQSLIRPVLAGSLMCILCLAACSSPKPPAEGTPTPVAAQQSTPFAPVITLSPAMGGAETQVTIVGRGFPPNARVSVRLHSPGAGAAPFTWAEATTDAQGNAGITFYMPAQWPDGRRITENKLIVAVAADDFGVQAEAEFSFVGAPVPPTPTVPQPAAPAPSPTPVADYPRTPAEVVDRFLQSLRADPGGARSLPYLSRSLQAEIQAGRSPLQILGIPAMCQSFIVAAGPQVGDSATFYVTFNFGASQQSRVIILAQEDSLWRINAIAAAEGATLGDPGQVTHDFLISLLRDPSGAGSLKYLTRRRAAEVEGGTSILALLGVQKLYKSFSYEILVMNSGGVSTIRVTLDYDDGPQARTFTLIQEGGGWRINDISR